MHSAGKAEMVEMLLDRGVDMDAIDRKGNSALGRARWTGRLEVVEMLISREAKKDHHVPLIVLSVTGNAKQGFGPAKKDRVGIVKLLLENGHAV